MFNWLLKTLRLHICDFCNEEIYRASEMPFQCKNFVRPNKQNKNALSAKRSNASMNIGDKVIAVGAGRKTKELNGGDIVRSHGRGGFGTLALEQVVMTIESIERDVINTPYYKFHKDDLHLVDSGRASVAIDEPEPEETLFLSSGDYTRAALEAKLMEFDN